MIEFDKLFYILLLIFLLVIFDLSIFLIYENQVSYDKVMRLLAFQQEQNNLYENKIVLAAEEQKKEIDLKYRLILNNLIKMKKENYSNKRILFTGDIMLDRGVESLMKKNGQDYPFLQVSDFLSQFDFVMANLEGAVVENPPVLPGDSLTFAFDASIVKLLNDNNISLVSLANNHTMNMRQVGLDETKKILAEAKINYIGEPIKCSDKYYQYDDLIFLAFNTTFNSCKNQEIVEIVEKIGKGNPDELLIINMHWGLEYKTINSKAQQSLAYQLIDAGADLIIGHHPHVVQNIEMYKGKIIFYSLGNFIFDQYFSQETQEGLLIGLNIGARKISYDLYPVSSNFSQPRLMEKENKQRFLENLVKNSSEDIKDEIRKAYIEYSK